MLGRGAGTGFDGFKRSRHCPPPMGNSDFEAARLTVRLGAMVENYRTCQRLAAPAAVSGVVKADAYGMGMSACAQALDAAGCNTYFVARLEEGVLLRRLVPAARIFVLDGAQADMVPALISHRLTPTLNSLAEIAAWRAAARETRTELDAAVHIDTGMNRLGLPGDELATLSADPAKRLENLRIVLWMSHLACADDPTDKMNGMQLDRFRTALAMLPPAPASLASSGGILLGKDYVFDMVRPGLGLYGGNPHPQRPNPFKTVAQITGRILQIRRVDAGQTVGYGATWRTGRPTTLATVALGYADGLMRALSSKGHGAIAGYRAPIAGRVSMDLVTLDVTDVPPRALELGADVEFLGETIGLDELAAAAGTAPYEVLTTFKPRAARHYVSGL